METIDNRTMPSSDAFAHYAYKPVSTGTTLIAAEFDGGVVIGADSRSSAGSFIVNRVTDKLTKVTDKIYCCRSGGVADTQAVADIVIYYLNVFRQRHQREPTVHIAAQEFRSLCYDYRDDLSAGILVCGWDEEQGGQVYAIPLGGMVIRRRVAAGGSGSTFVQGYLDSQWREGMSRQECEKFVKEAVTLAMLRDGSSGGVLRLGTITKDGIERQMFKPDQQPKFAEI